MNANKHWPLEGKVIWCHVCCAECERNNRIQVFRLQCGFVYWPMFWSTSYQLHLCGGSTIIIITALVLSVALYQ